MAILLVSAGLTLLTAPAHAETKALTGPYSAAASTRVPTPLPSANQGTSFTAYSAGPVPFVQGTFFVETAGTYTIQHTAVNTLNVPVSVGAYFLTGTFAPSAASNPTTPLSNFLSGRQGLTSATVTANLTPGVQYSYLLVFRAGTSGTYTSSIAGPGAICSISNCGNGPDVANAISRTLMQQRANAVIGVSVRDYTHPRLSSSLFGGPVSDEERDETSSPAAPASHLRGPRAIATGALFQSPAPPQTSSDQTDTPEATPGRHEAQLGFGISGDVDPNSPGNVRLAFSLDRVHQARGGRGTTPAGLSYLGATDAPSSETRPYNVWSEFRRAYFRDSSLGDRRSGHVSVSSTGVDYLLAPWLAAGIMLQWDWIDLGLTDNVIRSTASGNGWLVGPYVSMRLTPNLFFDARAAGGKTNNEVTPLGSYEDSFDTRRWLVSAELSGQWDFGPWRFKPSAELTYLKDEQESYASNGGGIVPGQTYELGRLTFGPELIYHALLDGGIALEPFVSLNGIWDFATDGSLTTSGQAIAADEFRGRVELGTAIVFPSTADLRFSGAYDGIGSDGYSIYEGRASLRVPF